MKDHLREKIQLMLSRYKKLGLEDSWLYKGLQRDIKNDQWLDGLVGTITKVRNSEKIFDVVGQMTKDEADHRLMTMFAEYDTAIRLTDWAKGFFGTFTDAEYLPRKNKRQPDFKVWNGNKVMPIETKTFKGLGDVEANKFYSKFIKKVRDDALPQLTSFYEDTPFEKGIIFIWTQQHVVTKDVRAHAYIELSALVQKEIKTDSYPFDTQVITMFANPLDLWDFDLQGTK